MESIINRLEALEAEYRFKQVTNAKELGTARTKELQCYHKGQEKVLNEVLLDLVVILRNAKLTA